MSLLILTSPPAVPHRILLHLRTRAKAILPRPTKRNLLPIHLRIILPTKAKVRINPTAGVINPTSPPTNLLTNNPSNLTAVLLTNRDLRLRTNRIVNPPHHTNPTASPLLLTNHHLNLTVNHHLLTNHQNPGAVLLHIRVRQKVQKVQGVLPPGRAPIRKKSK